MNSLNTMPLRLSYLDWLRVFSIVGVLFFHAAMPFVTGWDWHIKNAETSRVLLECNFWLSRFRMPLLFFISGAVAYCMLQKKTAAQFINLRFKRLLLPLLFGMLVLVPPQVYMERLAHGYTGSYSKFYAAMFATGPYPKGDISWHHLWFIAYLFVFDVLCTPLFVWLLRDSGKKLLGKLDFLAKNKLVYLLMFPGIVVFAILYFKYPETNDLINDWGRFFYWLSFLLAGFLCAASPLLMESIQKNRRTSLAVAIASFLIIAYLRWNNAEPWEKYKNWQNNIWTFLYIGLWGLTAWMWMFTAVGYGKKYLDRGHKALSYINQAAYPFYILHQTVIVIIVFYVMAWQDTVMMKYIFTAVLSFFLTLVIYHVFIRPFRVTRFLFGMKKIDTGSKRESVA